jgi:hypothetical protein
MVNIECKLNGNAVDPDDVGDPAIGVMYSRWGDALHSAFDNLRCPICGDSANIQVVLSISVQNMSVSLAGACHQKLLEIVKPKLDRLH